MYYDVPPRREVPRVVLPPKFAPKVRIRDMKCSKCLGQGHSARDCPSRRKIFINEHGEYESEDEITHQQIGETRAIDNLHNLQASSVPSCSEPISDDGPISDDKPICDNQPSIFDWKEGSCMELMVDADEEVVRPKVDVDCTTEIKNGITLKRTLEFFPKTKKLPPTKIPNFLNSMHTTWLDALPRSSVSLPLNLLAKEDNKLTPIGVENHVASIENFA